MDVMNFCVMDSDYGSIVLLARNGRLCRLDLVPSDIDARQWIRSQSGEAVESEAPFKKTTELLSRYFRGEQVEFDVPLDLTELKAFTRLVLTEIRKIPYGKLTHYGKVARSLGYPKAARAVGQALKRNPIPIVIPCHRIIRGDGSLGGFDMGLDMKAKLLSLEGVPVQKLRESIIPS